jgi:hypothetical protein
MFGKLNNEGDVIKVCSECGAWGEIFGLIFHYESCSGSPNVCYMFGRPFVQDATSLVLTERERQIAELEYTPEHDDTHTEGELRDLAIGYLQRHPEDDPIANLSKAGALVLAEIERLQRKGTS